MTDADQRRRVALLARPGAADDQLRDALTAAGADCVLQADPTGLDPSALRDAGAQVVLVALDPVTEETLQQFDEVLGDPVIDVIYEDAELAEARGQWDVARWQRHLVAKLQGHRDVLPPGRVPHAADAADTPGTNTDASDATDPVETAEVAQEATQAAATPTSSFGELSLDDDDADIASGPSTTDDAFRSDMDDLEMRISKMELVPDVMERPGTGAVLLLAGLGGPDAVRQLLGALPVGFGQPVLVQQRLDGGRHDKLVAQMQRASALPVELAKPGQRAEAGIVYILADSIGVTADDDGVAFDDSGNDVLSVLPAADSAVLMLSGSDPGRVDAAMKHSWSGALVAGQAAEGCYDAAAARDLSTRGGETGTPVQLAAKLAKRWPATESDES